MTEEAITKLGFEKVHPEKPNYYYFKKVGNIEFTTNARNEVLDGSWYTDLFESGIRFHSSTELKTVIDLLEYNKIF
tara:strand:+ start:742 stop:969 length:228 start_codon:yes stop_codon:yes gene_type:complete